MRSQQVFLINLMGLLIGVLIIILSIIESQGSLDIFILLLGNCILIIIISIIQKDNKEIEDLVIKEVENGKSIIKNQ